MPDEPICKPCTEVCNTCSFNWYVDKCGKLCLDDNLACVIGVRAEWVLPELDPDGVRKEREEGS